jgi:PhzF family phenazine biosynthesis protein
MDIPIIHVDAFTDRPFLGNPAAVCLLTRPAEPDWMQAVAREMNLSETAFLHPDGGDWSLRWFSPLIEVDLCGHATLAAAHVLLEGGRLAPGEAARFRTRSGMLTAVSKEGGWIEMDFPSEPEQPAATPDALVRALGVAPRYVGRNRFDYLVEVDSESAVRSLSPDMALLRTLDARGVMVTGPSDSGEFDFVSRFFGPAAGIPEDPVTGSAHCCLGPFWRTRLKKDAFVAYQASPRGGVVRVRVAGDRVILGGRAVTVFSGKLTV